MTETPRQLCGYFAYIDRSPNNVANAIQLVATGEKDPSGQSARPEPRSTDDELFPLSGGDPRFADAFYQGLLNGRVTSITVLARKARSARMAQLPNEVS